MLPAIVIAAYNRPDSLLRLLRSVKNARYAINEIPLIISIDKSDNEQVKELAQNFDWQYGKKIVLLREAHMGLRKHILACGDLSAEYGSIILLEDDLMVSSHFYEYAQKALAYYENEEKIAGISLYNYQIAESCQYPFLPLHDDSDIYFMRFAASWGQAWTAQQWQDFSVWYAANSNITATEKLPHFLTLWSEQSWKRHFIRYLRTTDRYFVYPRLSLSTNFGDPGTGDNTQGLFQTPLQTAPIEYRFKNIADSYAIYDECFEIMPAALNRLAPDLAKYDYAVDLYATKNPEQLEAEYLLSSRPITKSELSFGMEMLPDATNIVQQVPGNFISLAKRTAFIGAPRRPRHEYYYRIRSVSRHIFNDWVEQRADEKAYAIADSVANELANQRFEKYVQHWKFEREFPSILIVTPVLEGEKKSALETAKMVQQCAYPNCRHLLLAPPDVAKALQTQLGNTPKLEVIATNENGANSEFAALEQGLNHAETILMTWLPCGTKYEKNALHLVAKAFNRFVEMNWLLALPANEKAENYRFHQRQFYAASPELAKLRLSHGLAFWRSGLWQKVGKKIALKYGKTADLELWSRFFEHEKPYVLAYELGTARPQSGVMTNREDATAFEELRMQKRPDGNTSFAKNIFQKALKKGYDAHLPVLGTLYTQRNALSPLIRYDESGDSLYLSSH